MLGHSDNDVSISDFGYVGNWISQCNDSNNNIRMDIRNNKLKIFELSSTNYSECNNRSFSSQSTSEYSYNTVASTEEEKKSQIVRLEVLSSSGSSIGDLVFYMDADNLYFESEVTDSSFPLTGGFSEGLLFSIKRSDPLKRKR